MHYKNEFHFEFINKSLNQMNEQQIADKQIFSRLILFGLLNPPIVWGDS